MQKVNIIEDFYDPVDFGLMTYQLNNTAMKGIYKPTNVFYPDRLQAYPVWETDTFSVNSQAFNIFKNTFEKKTNLKIKEINSFFRKIHRSELEQSPYKGREESMVHQDDTDSAQLAGVVYFDSFSIKDGTRIYSYRDQIEPDLIVGSKPNRCVFYDPSLFHSAGIDWRRETRSLQIFFIRGINTND